MENTGHVSLSRQSVLRRELSIVANNLANLNTNAFRGERLAFVEHLQKTANGDQLTFVQGIATVRDYSEGPKIRTGSDLDLAIEGRGYFEVESDDGLLYTRDGAFRLNADSELVTRDGHRVLDNGGSPIQLAGVEGSITINPSGTVYGSNGPVGQIKIVNFENEALLTKLPGSLYDSNGEAPLDTNDFILHQGFLEGSNVIGIAEMTRMMEIVRNYSSASKLIDEEHRRQKKTLDTLGARQF